MDINYSFLDDQRALEEIRKHKWIESEKLGKEIGFATAAVDWVKRHGPNWRKSRVHSGKIPDIFQEKRLHRRFLCPWALHISSAQHSCDTLINDLNLLGVSCTVTKKFDHKTPLNVTITFPKKKGRKIDSNLSFTSNVKKTTRILSPRRKPRYRVFLPFSDEIKEFLQSQFEQLQSYSI